MRKVLKGQRYIGLYRSARPDDDAIERQKVNVWLAAAEYELVHVDDVLLEGVEGTSGKIDGAIEELASRKSEKNDFDLVLVAEVPNLTTGGVMHFMRLNNMLWTVGARLLAVDTLKLRDPLSAMVWRAAATDPVFIADSEKEAS